MANPRFRVPAPTFAPLPYGLLSVAQVVDSSDPHWRNGLEWEAGCSAKARATLAPCYEITGGGPSTPIAKSGLVGVGLGDGEAFTLYAVHECSTGGRTLADDRERAGRLLTNGESRGLESVLRDGVTEAGTLTRSLSASSTLIAGTQSLAAGIGLLEEALGASSGGVGVIHLPRALALQAFALGLVVKDGARLVTGLGTPVAAGAGYTGAPSATATIYASGPVLVYRGSVNVLDGFDRSVNTSIVIAERSYAAGFECSAFRVVVSTGVVV